MSLSLVILHQSKEIITAHPTASCYIVGGGPTLLTSILPISKGKKTNAKQLRTMMGNAIYNPTSNASVLPPAPVVVVTPSLLILSPNFPSKPLIPGADTPPGTIPPSVADRISSSVASHDFIFSARLTADDEEGSPLLSSSLPSPAAPARRRAAMMENPLLVIVKTVVAGGEKAYEACSIASMTRQRIIMMLGEEVY
jgi:hypothetical protein